MPPHGPGMTGAGHSHNPEYPEDNYNLYTMLDPASTTALNVTQPSDCLGIFKPYAMKSNPNPHLISDADEEIIIIARFTSPVSVRKLIVMGCNNNSSMADTSTHPRVLKCYCNQEDIDFTSVQAYSPAQEFQLPVNVDGSIELTTVLHAFTLINSLVFYFPANYGSDHTMIQYIGMQGEHTHYRREAVNATYELISSDQDVKQGNEEETAAFWFL